MLNKIVFETMLQTESRYVFAIKGLRTTTSPCGAQSRWKQLNCAVDDCAPTEDSDDVALVKNALQSATGWLRDVTVDCSSVAANSVVEISEHGFFQHVHSSEYNVYDFTDWALSHPGGANNIQKWAGQDYEVQFPSGHATSRFEQDSTQFKLDYVGKLGYSVQFESLPVRLQTPQLAAILGIHTSSGYEVCGSPGEVASNSELGNQVSFYSLELDINDKVLDNLYNTNNAKVHDMFPKLLVWTATAMKADDQLRQRVAWALNQIYVTGITGFGQTSYSEMWINFTTSSCEMPSGICATSCAR